MAIVINFMGCSILLVYNKYKIDKTIIYIVLAGLLGPGLIVNACLKEHVGRARPKEIIEFKGIKKFTRAFTLSNECDTNCSFPSGHAAFAYYLTVWSIVYNKRKNTIFLFFIIFGTVVGLVRIIQGGHFLSDVVASCFIVLFVNWLLFKLLNLVQFAPKQYKSI
jgi:lipid A 4'-phosphatase